MIDIARLFLLLVMLCVTSNGFAKEALRAIVDINGVKIEPQLINHYQSTLTQALNQKVILEQKSIFAAKSFDILISDNSELMPNWYQPVYILDILPAINRISINEAEKQTQLSAVVNRPYMLTEVKNTYPAENSATAARLLQKKKVDYIIDYEKNNSFYRSLKKELSYSVLSEQANIIVKFKNADLEKLFSQSAIELQNLPTFNGDLTASTKTPENIVEWYLVGKSINKKEILQPYPGESSVTNYLIEQLNGVSVKTDSATVSAVFNTMNKQDNVCLFNTFKSKKRQEIAYYSTVTNFYLDYRIILPKGSALDKKLNRDFSGEPINLLSLLANNKELLLGYYWFDRASLPKTWLAYFNQNPEQVTQLKESDIERSYQLLSRDRVDLIIAYESVFGPHMPESFDIQNFTSYAIEGRANHAQAYMACSKSELGKNIIAQVDRLFQSQESRTQIISRYLPFMTDNGQVEFKSLFSKH